MASSPPLPTTDEAEEDNGFGKSNFQRAYMKGGITTSPRGTSKEKDGFFNRLSGKALDYQKKKNAQLEEQVSTLKIELQNEMQKYLQKIHSVVLQLRESGLSGSEYQMMEQLKDMDEISTTNDEFYTIENAFESLKADEETKSFKYLNTDAKRGIRIIVYKFGSMTRQAFANGLGLRLEKQCRVEEELVDEHSCTTIIIHWLKIHGNNIPKLIGILKGIENQFIQDSMQDLKEQTFAKCLDTPEKDSEVGTPISLRRKRRIGDSVLSLKSNRSDVSETLELIEKHASETLQKTADFPHIKPDIEALLCAMYTLQMDNSRTLHAIGERIGASGNKVNVLVSDEKTSESYRNSSATEHGKNSEDCKSEKYV